jgi:uncharacterized surface protein with fasciclin (FAS1) repeats
MTDDDTGNKSSKLRRFSYSISINLIKYKTCIQRSKQSQSPPQPQSKSKMQLLYTILATSIAATITVEVANPQATRHTLDIPSTAVNAGIFTTLVTALDVTNLTGPLSTPNGPYTVFAPTDDIFTSVPNGLVSCLLEDANNQILTGILLYHGGCVRSSIIDSIDRWYANIIRWKKCHC